ncbi:MAG: ABC transporter substrate-binding protein, partial [Phascolarctobacterium faecium]
KVGTSIVKDLSGGLLGKKIELVVADNKSEPAEAANAMSKLVNQDKAPVVMGLFASSSAIAASNVSEAAKVPFLAVGATNPKVTLDEKTGKVKPNTFRVCFIDPFQGTVGANFILNELKLQKAAVYIDNSSDYAKVWLNFSKAYTEKGGTVVIEESYL